jgi:ABC-type lipoprotein release transport system permease subunit
METGRRAFQLLKSPQETDSAQLSLRIAGRMKFSWFLALRYLKPKRTFISIITVISILGVALGVGVLIVVIAVMSGFEKRIKDEWLKVEPPIHLFDDNRDFLTSRSDDKDSEKMQTMWRDELLPKLRSFPGVESASPFLHVVSLVQTAPSREHDATSIEVKPEGLPPEEPPPDGSDPAPPVEEPKTPGTPAPAESPDVPQPAEALDEPAPGDAPIPAEPAPADEAPGESTEPDISIPAPDEDSSVTGLDRTRPLSPAIIIGVDPEDVKQMGKLERRFRELLRRVRKGGGFEIPSAWGEFDISGETIVLSHDVARKLTRGSESGPIEVGLSRVNLFGPSYINEGIDIIEEQRQAKGDKAKQAAVEDQDREYPLPMDLTITGVFDDDKQTAGSQGGVAYVSLKTAQHLAGAGKAVDGIHVELDDPYDAPAMVQKLDAAGLIPNGWHAETWIDRHRTQFEAVKNERSMMYIVLSFIVVVAAFCIMNTMIVFAVQKRREIGMMRALGAKTSNIVTLFMTQGCIVGLVGTTLGYLLGHLVLYFRNDLRDWINDSFGHQIFDASIYGLNEIPAELRGMDQVMIGSGAVLLCVIAAIIPAFLVGWMEPARALRNDR